MVQQISIKIDSSDLRKIDDKVKRYGISRSSMMKYLALNAELSYEIRGHIKTPKI